MHSTLNPKTGPQHVLAARMDEELARTYEKIARADEQIARVEEELSKLEHERHSSDDPPTRMNTFQPAVPGNRPSVVRPARRGFIGLLLAACIGVAALAWQSPSGDAARRIVAAWVPQLVSTSSAPLENSGLPAQPSPSAAPAVTPAASAQAAPLAQSASKDVAPTAAPVSPELAQLIQTIVHDLANVQQGLEQLKASQEQMASENAKSVEQLKASQEQMARLIAKGSEQNLRPKTSATPPRVAIPARKPVPLLPPQQARGRAQTPPQLQDDDQ
jgi:hypothetical protein